MSKDIHGFAGLTLVLALVLIFAIGFAGYTVFNEDKEVVDTGDSSSPAQVENNQDPITDSSDIDTGLGDIDDIDLESEFDTSEFDEALNEI